MRPKFARAVFPPTTVLLLVACTLVTPSVAYERTAITLLAQAKPTAEAEGSGDKEQTPPSNANAAEASEESAETEPSQEDLQAEEDLARDLGLTKSGQDNPRIVRRSLENILQKSQEAHDRVLVDRFLIWVSVLFAMISLMLFLSQPPRRKKKQVQPLKAK